MALGNEEGVSACEGGGGRRAMALGNEEGGGEVMVGVRQE